jgi:hypothetical protein
LILVSGYFGDLDIWKPFLIFVIPNQTKEKMDELNYLKHLSKRDLELLKMQQFKVLEYSVIYERILITERGSQSLEEMRNLALDKIIFINKILKERFLQ